MCTIFLGIGHDEGLAITRRISGLIKTTPLYYQGHVYHSGTTAFKKQLFSGVDRQIKMFLTFSHVILQYFPINNGKLAS